MVAYACAMSLLANSGDPVVGVGFSQLINTFWNLIKTTVGNAPGGFAKEGDNTETAQLFEVLRTFFYVIANILMIK